MFDKELIRKINNGRCFVLVGSGPSCEMGYPSWHKLAELTYEELEKRGCVSDSQSYEKYLEEKKYPELFRQAERDLEDRYTLINLLKTLLNPTVEKHSVLYNLISKWPFACYLTTNYDDEIENHLSKLNEHFEVIRNRREDFFLWRDGVSNLIQKLHSDLDHSDEVILTSTDYQRVYVEDSHQYFRDRLCDIFKMFDVFIIGHSLSDPDIDYILRLARKARGPQHPIYIAATGLTNADEQEYSEKYNIEVVGYSNSDGTHSELQRILKSVDRFIVPRARLNNRGEIAPSSEEEIEAATAIFLYRHLQGVQTSDYLSPLILSGLYSASPEGVVSKNITSLPTLKMFMKEGTDYGETIDQTISELNQQDLISVIDGNIKITSEGCAKVQEFQSIRENEKNQAYGQFKLKLRDIYNNVNDLQLTECERLAKEVIVASFENRGSVIANKIFSDRSPRPKELSDVFGYVSDKAFEIEEMELRSAFIDAMHQFLIEPTLPQCKYLASISQGYFLYHLLGLQPNFCGVRKDVFQKTLWFCDSSVLLPLIAIGCHNHEYTVDLFRKLADENAIIYTTRKLLQEAWKHFEWASNFITNTGSGSLEFLRAALVKGSYKQNLFLDGYIRLCADGKVGTFNDYLELIFPAGTINQPSFDEVVSKTGLCLMLISDVDGFVQDDWSDFESAKDDIKERREQQGIYRSELQVEAEAEVWLLLKNLRSGKYSIGDLEDTESVYFVSQSRLMDKVFQQETYITWHPESLYRYLSALPGKEINPDLLQQCMLNDHYAGISFIDKARYERFFGPGIDAAKASYKEQRESYIKEIEGTYINDIDDAYEQTQDLEKPFFVSRMGWQLAEASKQREDVAVRRALEAEKKVKQLEAEKEKAWKTREEKRLEQEASTLRNLRDPKHMRKRERQAKKRKRKKK